MHVHIFAVVAVERQFQFSFSKSAELADELELLLQLRGCFGICNQLVDGLPVGEDLELASHGLYVITGTAPRSDDNDNQQPLLHATVPASRSPSHSGRCRDRSARLRRPRWRSTS